MSDIRSTRAKIQRSDVKLSFFKVDFKWCRFCGIKIVTLCKRAILSPAVTQNFHTSHKLTTLLLSLKAFPSLNNKSPRLEMISEVKRIAEIYNFFLWTTYYAKIYIKTLPRPLPRRPPLPVVAFLNIFEPKILSSVISRIIDRKTTARLRRNNK